MSMGTGTGLSAADVAAVVDGRNVSDPSIVISRPDLAITR